MVTECLRVFQSLIDEAQLLLGHNADLLEGRLIFGGGAVLQLHHGLFLGLQLSLDALEAGLHFFIALTSGQLQGSFNVQVQALNNRLRDGLALFGEAVISWTRSWASSINLSRSAAGSIVSHKPASSLSVFTP